MLTSVENVKAIDEKERIKKEKMRQKEERKLRMEKKKARESTGSCRKKERKENWKPEE